MAELRMLAPHDPVPESGHHLIVMRRFAEDAPRLTVTEMIASDGRSSPERTVPTGRDGTPLDFPEAVQAARARAERDGFPTVFAVDRTAGPREREVLAHGGDHSVHADRLLDSDLEEGEPGPDMRDRPQEGGRNLTPERAPGTPPPVADDADAAALAPGRDAPSRSGISGPGSGADSERG